MPVDEKTYFEMQLDSTIREIEKLLKKLKEVKKDYTERRREDALEKSVAAARISEGVALKTRALPAHTGHPRAGAMIQTVTAEAIPVEIGFTEQNWFLPADPHSAAAEGEILPELYPWVSVPGVGAAWRVQGTDPVSELRDDLLPCV